MLAQLGENRIEVSGPRIGGRIGVLATRSSDKEIQMIIYNYNETDDELTILDNIDIQISGLVIGDYTIEEFSLDRKNNNTYRTWEKQGSPKTSKDADLESLRKAADLSLTNSFRLKNTANDLELKLKLPRHSMKLIKIRIQ